MIKSHSILNLDNPEPQVNSEWYVLYTKFRWEKKVIKKLTNYNIEFYCPLHRVNKQWSDRKKITFEPLFTSYIFVKLEDPKKFPFKFIDGAVSFVYWLNKPAIVRSEEINTIKRFLNDYEHVKIEKTAVSINDNVKILSGPFLEREGKVLEVKHRTVKIFLPSLGYNILAEIEKSKIEIVTLNQRSVSNSPFGYSVD